MSFSRLSRLLLASALAGILTGSLAAPSGAYERPGETSLVSVALLNTPNDQEAVANLELNSRGEDSVDISWNGRYVVWETPHPLLVLGDTNLMTDVFRRDLKTGVTTRVSVDSSGTEARTCVDRTGETTPLSNPSYPSVSADGRFVAFTSCASNLVLGDTNESPDVFVHDIATGSTKLVSVGLDGGPAAGPPAPFLKSVTSSAAISSNGRFVAFHSSADNLVKGDTNAAWDTFVRDTKKGYTEIVSLTTDGRQSDGQPSTASSTATPWGLSISSDGRYVAFKSSATNLADGQQYASCYLHDRQTGSTSLVGNPNSVAGYDDLGESSFCKVSGDGRYVAYSSALATLIPNDGNKYTCALGPGQYDAFVTDMKTLRTERVSVTSNGFETCENASYGGIDIGASGRYVVFSSRSGEYSPLDPPDNPALGLLGYSTYNDVYVHDRATGATELVSRSTGNNAPETGESLGAAITPSGRFIAFWSEGWLLDSLPPVDVIIPRRMWVRDRGFAVGADGEVSSEDDGLPVDLPPAICITEARCIDRLGPMTLADREDEIEPSVGQWDLIEARIAYRPQLDDLFVVEELRSLPGLSFGTEPLFIPGTIYGFRFSVGGRKYEVRAVPGNSGTFGLFDCSGQLATCTLIANLDGGFGTTGERIVFSLPLDKIGLGQAGELSDVEAFTGLGSYVTGPSKTLDSITPE